MKTIPSSLARISIGDRSAGRPILAADGLEVARATHHLYQRLGARCALFWSRGDDYETSSASYTTSNEADAARSLAIYGGTIRLTRVASNAGAAAHFIKCAAVADNLTLELRIFDPSTNATLATLEISETTGTMALVSGITTISGDDAAQGGLGGAAKVLGLGLRAKSYDGLTTGSLRQVMIYESYITADELPNDLAAAPVEDTILLESGSDDLLLETGDPILLE